MLFATYDIYVYIYINMVFLQLHVKQMFGVPLKSHWCLLDCLTICFCSFVGGLLHSLKKAPHRYFLQTKAMTSYDTAANHYNFTSRGLAAYTLAVDLLNQGRATHLCLCIILHVAALPDLKERGVRVREEIAKFRHFGRDENSDLPACMKKIISTSTKDRRVPGGA